MKGEKLKAAIEGARLTVGKIIARFALIEMDATDEAESKKVHITSLRCLEQIITPEEIIFIVYVVLAIHL